MPFYNSAGQIPKKRHTVFKNPKGGIYYEELVSREGFSYMYSNLYHLRMPTRICGVNDTLIVDEITSNNVPENIQHRPRHFYGKNDTKHPVPNWYYASNLPLLYNEDVRIYSTYFSPSTKEEDTMTFQRNGHFDMLYYIQEGKGTLKTNFGNLDFHKGDYIIIPRGVIYYVYTNEFVSALEILSNGPIETPTRYRNRVGQLLEHSPFCERDIRIPKLMEPIDKEGKYLVCVRLKQGFQYYSYANHPFDLVGWDGYYFPWILNINDFEPITGSIHQPPPVHQTFQGKGFVVCSFVSRLFDYHPDSIPAPYPHSNLDSDEVIFYSKGDFMSRKGINKGSITYHPMGLPHGPQPGKYEESIGKKKTNELAVMIDTFKPLCITKHALAHDDKNYPMSWMEKNN